MASNEKNEVLWINTLKGGCILLVVLHHTIITTFAPSLQYLSAGSTIARLWVSFNTYLSPLRMPAFFFVSGLLAASAISKKSWKEVFTKKFSNLIYLYILWGIIQWASIYNISANLIGERLSSSQNAVYAETPWEFIKLLVLSMTSLWYLYALAGYFIAAKLFYRYKYGLFLVAVIVSYLAQLGFVPGWGPTSVTQNFIYFLLGAFFSTYLIELSTMTRRSMLLLTGFVLLGVAHHFFGLYKNIFYCMLSIVAGIVLCRELNRRFDMRWLNWIGRNTLQIYVLHRIFIELFGLGMLSLAASYRLFGNTAFSLTWSLSLPIVAVVTCTVLPLLVWSVLNRGPGRIFFLYPRLIYKTRTLPDVASNG